MPAEPKLTVTALAGLPEIAPRDDLAALIAAAVSASHRTLLDGDVVVVAHKIVSKAEGRIRRLGAVSPGERAITLARELGKDPRHVQVVLDESRRVLRAAHGVLICETVQGFVCANAGVDASNVRGEGDLVLLPRDADVSARALRSGLRSQLGVSPGVLITDSFGRAWRRGQVDVAIGCAGVGPLEDWRGRSDAFGRKLKATWIAVIDELAAAADLARAKDDLRPVVLVRGAGRHVTPEDGPGAVAMIRPEAEDLFR
ncbi:MAG TPA: coenzyme F420-0:L-glutamate ligase [Solirubrobacteraceae bacterium]